MYICFLHTFLRLLQIVTCSDDSQQKIFRIKNGDPDDLDASLLIRGRAEPVDQEVLDRSSKYISLSQNIPPQEKCKGSPSINSRSTGLPKIPKTPSSIRKASIDKNDLLVTPSRKDLLSGTILSTPQRVGAGCSGYAVTPLRQSTKEPCATPLRGPCTDGASSSSTMKLLTTPRHRRSTNESPMTPSSVDRSVSLLQWLSSTKKTPRPLDSTPRAEVAACISAKKKAGIKRKLTEVMEDFREDQENFDETYLSAAKKAPISPTENVFFNIDNESSSQCGAAVKMLTYQNNVNGSKDHSKSTGSSMEIILGIGDSVQPFESSMLDSLLDSTFRSSFGEPKNSVPEGPSSSLSKPNLTSSTDSSKPTVNKNQTSVCILKSRFESPTANLPNFVLDGRSPRVRPTPIFQPQPDWLTSLGKVCRLKATPDKKEDLLSSRKSKKTGRKQGTNRGSKKYLKIVALTDTPITKINKSAKKTTQTKLNFNS